VLVLQPSLLQYIHSADTKRGAWVRLSGDFPLHPSFASFASIVASGHADQHDLKQLHIVGWESSDYVEATLAMMLDALLAVLTVSM
jgi:hypothetical protein